MSDAANPRPETADERAAALLADAARASHQRYPASGMSLPELMQPQKIRLNEIERTAIRRLYRNLVESTEGELRSRMLAQVGLPDMPEFRASLGAAHVAIAWPAFVRAGFAEDPELADILVQRAKSYGIMRNLRQNVVVAENSRLDVLTEHGDPDIARDAMKLLIAESRFNDRFDDPRLGREDLPESADRRLVWTVAAALRDYGQHKHDLDGWSLDDAITGAAIAMLDEQDDGAPADVAAMALASRLDRAGLIDGALLVEALNSARLTLYVAMLAVRAGVDFSTGWEMVAMPDAPSHMLLLKSIDTERAAASHLLVAMARAILLDQREADEIAARWMESYEILSPEAVVSAMRPWRLGHIYRSAITRFAVSLDGGAQ